MGKAAKAVTKTVSKVVKTAAKPVTNVVRNTGKIAENYVSGIKHMAQGDFKGALKKATNALEYGAGNVTAGTVDFSGDKKGFINIDADKYADTLMGKVKTPSTPVSQTDLETDGLLQYVADLRTRKSRRNRASTVNTDGSASNNLNKLGGTTALGV